MYINERVLGKVKSRTFGALSVASLLTVSALAVIGTHGGQASAEVTPTAGEVIFEDDFNGEAGALPNQSKWEDYSACSYNASAAFGDIKCGDNETLDGNGSLIVPATPTAGSAIRTGDKFKFQYGTMSAWIKTPPQVGYWPAFWSLNSPANGQEALPVGEVDAIEGYTTWNDVYHAAGHNHTGDSATTSHSADYRCAEGQGLDLSAGYNKYSAKIEPYKITYYFNDVQCGSSFIPDADPNKPWAFGPTVTRGNWLILDLAIGGAGGQQLPATAAAEMLVDRVEVRSLEQDPTAIASGETYKLVNQCGGKALEVPDSSTTDGAALKVSGFTGGDNQQWDIVNVGGYYKLINKSTGKAANVSYNSTSAGVNVIQWPDFGGSNQEWNISSLGDGNYQLLARHSGKALDVSGANPNDGASVIQWHANTGCSQKWQIIQS